MSSPRSGKPLDEEPRRDGSSGDTGVPEGDDPSFPRRWWSRVEAWRRLMLGGGVILLLAAILRARLGDSFPDSALFASNVGGYLLLALGFAQFFRDRGNK
ncbi:MAG: hypothetical protein GEU68_07805 [Actinobacteria bacterium]|nr:hypothetical protein [Actinomycetota bacterium]